MKPRRHRHLVTLLLIFVVAVSLVGGIPTLNGAIQAAGSPSRVKRGYSSGHSTGIAYNRINDAGHVRLLSGGHRGHGGGGKGGGHGHDEDGHGSGAGSRGGNPIGEDGTHTKDFKSYGVGYEHRHGGHCEESKCGYNIRHCPHGCVFNSLLCGGGRMYDTCCC